MQKTILNNVIGQGHGVHSNKPTILTVKPAPANSGIIFVRTDLTGDNQIRAHYVNVRDTRLSTTIANESGAKVSTIEHFMAAAWGLGIDNLIVEIDNEEMPIMDGSSQSFVEILKQGGVQEQNAPKKILKLLKTITIEDGDCHITAMPSDKLHLSVTIDFEHPIIGQQAHICTSSESFLEEVATARTFGFIKDLEMLKKIGLANGASLENTIGIDDEKVLNPEGLKHENEFARHKLLDLIGDLFTCGGHFIFQLEGHKTSHKLNNMFLNKLFASPDNYEWVDL